MTVHLPGTPHAMKVALLWARDGQRVMNTFYLEDDTDGIFDDFNATGALINTAAVANLIPEIYPACSYVGCHLEDIRTTTFTGLDVLESTPVAGTASGGTASLPNSVTFSIKKLTGAPGRAGRGRWYWPDLNQHDSTGIDTISSTKASNYQGALLAFQGDIEGGPPAANFGIVSYFLNKVMRTSGQFERITSWAVADLVYDSQRRRLPGRGM